MLLRFILHSFTTSLPFLLKKIFAVTEFFGAFDLLFCNSLIFSYISVIIFIPCNIIFKLKMKKKKMKSICLFNVNSLSFVKSVGMCFFLQKYGKIIFAISVKNQCYVLNQN